MRTNKSTIIMTRALAAAGGLAIASALAVSCSAAKEATKDAASAASSAAGGAASAVSTAASAAGSAASTAAGAAGSAASSAASAAGSAASSVASSVLSGTPTTLNVPGIGDVALDGPTAAVYEKAGGATALGAPTAAPEKIKDADSGGEGTVYAFENGTIFTSPDHGPKLVQGEILRIYTGEQGGPAGALGWPTEDEAETGGGSKVAGGGWIGEFENGSISWLNDGKGTFSETVTMK